jgi:hypothetical protein
LRRAIRRVGDFAFTTGWGGADGVPIPTFANPRAEIAMTKQRRSTSRRERQAAAEELAIAALGFIAGEPEQLGRFLAMTGIGPNSLRDAARDPRFLAGVLDHVAADEALLLAFAAANEIDPEAVMRARDVLTGGHLERDMP